MTVLEALLLGVVQGVTEFLPVSSTAHLILVPWVLGWRIDPGEQFVFDVLVQDGTLLAVLVYFRRDLGAMARALVAGLARRAPLGTAEARLGWWVILGSLPIGVLGIAFREFVREIHGLPAVVAGILLVATALLYAGERWGRRDRGTDALTARDALHLGSWQALALLPGVSRSGATIAGGLLVGLDRPAAARFSFLLAIPALLGAGALETWDLLRTPGAVDRVPALAAGFLAAAVVGFAAIHWLLRFLARRPLTAFGPYRIAAALALLGLALWRD